MAIQALSQEPCDVSVGEKEPNEITEEVTLRFFKNSLKVRWHDFVIYNVEWLKKNWQMEMDIVCGVKPCDDVVSREYLKKIAQSEGAYGYVSAHDIATAPSVTQKLGKWIGIDEEPHEDYECSCCGYVVSTFTANIEPHTEYKYCPNCGAKMIEPQENEEISERNMKMWEEIFKAESEDKK